MPVFKFNFKNHHNSFFFNALFLSVVFAAVLVVNDEADSILMKYIRYENKPVIKLIIHVIIMLIFTFILTYFFQYLFGWGDSLLG